MNLVTLFGGLGADAEVRATPSGTTICSFSVAVDSGYGDNKKTVWFRCKLIGKRAEGKLPGYLVKGQQVLVHGEVSLDEWDGKEGKRCSLEVFVKDLRLAGGKQAAPAQRAAPAPAGPDAPGDTEIPF